MRLGILFSGGKDSTLALLKVMKREKVVCLVAMVSKNEESYMFHTPNISLTKLQAKAIDLPLIQRKTEGIKEEELADLGRALAEAKRKFRIQGVVSGAVESSYQAERIQKKCNELSLCSINPLWRRNQEEILWETVRNGFKTIITGVFAYPLNMSWLGKQIDEESIAELVGLARTYGINPLGEGGEIETTVLDAPMFKKRIDLLETKVVVNGSSGVLVIDKARLSEKS